MKSDVDELRGIIMGMRAAYARGENAMAYARGRSQENSLVSTLIAYDLQAGSYVAAARANPDYTSRWCVQLADLLQPFVEAGDSLLEVGVGEATTLAGVINAVGCSDLKPLGFDVSWSRIKVANEWISENSVDAHLFVGDLFRIPLEDNSIDVVYTSHSLEPNGGKEKAAMNELLRVARKAVVLVEPIYELANQQAQKRMAEHGYVSGLRAVAEQLGAKVVDYGLLDTFSNPLNPSGVVSIVKPDPVPRGKIRIGASWQCPLTGTQMIDEREYFYAAQVGIAYPVLRGVPLLRAEHGVVASQMEIDG